MYELKMSICVRVFAKETEPFAPTHTSRGQILQSTFFKPL